MADGVVDFFDGREYLAKPRFELWFVKILPDCFVKIVLPLDNGVTEFFQLLNAFFSCGLCDFPAVFLLFFKNVLDFYKCIIVHDSQDRTYSLESRTTIAKTKRFYFILFFGVLFIL